MLYTVIAGLSVFALCFLMPPFQVNDEFQHFFRSYQISQGVMAGRVQGQTAGGDLPASLPALVVDFLGSLSLYAVHPVAAEPLARTFSFLAVPLKPSNTVFADFSATALYAPMGYVPQALGIALARLSGLGPLGCLFAGRLADGFAAIVMTGFAVRLAPFGRYALFTAGLLPTVLSLDASVSQDASVIAALLLFIALCLRAYERHHWSFGSGGVAAVAGIIFTASKLAYAPVLCLAMAPCFAADTSRARSAMVIAPAVVCTLIWAVISHNLAVWHDYGNDAGQQLAFILHKPAYFLAVVLVDIMRQGLLYIRSATSMMVGWPPEIALPRTAFLLIIATFIALPFAGGRLDVRLGRLYRCLILCLIPICGFAVLTVIYLTYEPVGGALIEQAQGRHFIPLLPLVALVLATARMKNVSRAAAGAARNVIVAVPAVNAVILILVICERYRLTMM